MIGFVQLPCLCGLLTWQLLPCRLTCHLSRIQRPRLRPFTQRAQLAHRRHSRKPKSLLTSNDLDFDTVLQLQAYLGDLYSLWKQRIENRRSFSYFVGCEHWRDLMLHVEEGILIPWLETEFIVDLADDAINNNKELKQGLWVDFGTGSGVIAIRIGRILEDFGRVFAIDLSPIVVQVASFNVKRYDLQDKVAVKQWSWFQPLSEFKGRVARLEPLNPKLRFET